MKIVDRLRADAWQIVQAAAAAGLAWWLASTLLQLPQTFFAPFAAIVALLGGTGGRGRRAVRMIAGVAVGVLVGELMVGFVGPGAGPVVLAAAIAMTLMSLMSGLGGPAGSLPLIHSGVAAVIVVTMDDPASGLGRVGAALIGGTVALLFTQVLFTPSPTRLLTGAMSAVRRACAEALRTPSGAGVGDLAGPLVALGEARGSAASMSHDTVRGFIERQRVRELDAQAARLDEMAADVIALVRTRGERDLRDLAEAMDAVAAGPPDAVAGLATHLRAAAAPRP